MQFTKEKLTRIIESADDVITTLAGTNEDCHRESDDMIRLWDYLNDIAAPPAIVKKLAEMALAGMEAEPYGYLRENDGQIQISMGPDSPHNRSGGYATPWFTIYTSPPAPVVPDNKAITQHFDDIALETAREIMCDVNRRHEFPGGEAQLLSRIQCRIDDACRVAMLQDKLNQD